jgi:hypothetical protein
MINIILDKIKKEDIVLNELRSKQIGNYCYLIAGMELLFANKTFLKFCKYYIKNSKVDTFDISKFCNLLLIYYKSRNYNFYKTIENIIFTELDIKNFGEPEDANVIFLYLQKSRIYCLFFSEFKLIEEEFVQELKSPYAIYCFLPNFFKDHKNTKTLIPYLKSLKIYGFIVHAAGHFEIYTKNDYKNTNYLNNHEWTLVYIFCKRTVIF